MRIRFDLHVRTWQSGWLKMAGTKKRQKASPGLRRRVLSWNLPPAWVPIVVACLLSATTKDLGCVEIFSGAGAVARGCAAYGMKPATIELSDGQDITTPSGLRLTIEYLCRCKPQALVWLGVPCSSWIFCGRSNAGRYTWWIRGNEKLAYTRKHNEIADISASLAWLACCLGLVVVLEQPLTSELFSYPPMQRAIWDIGASRVQVWLDAFGATSQKPLQLWGNAPWLGSLEKLSRALHRNAQPTERLTTQTTRDDGTKSVTGRTGAMKDSSAYPDPFGVEVGRLHAQLLQPAVGPRRRIFSLMDD